MVSDDKTDSAPVAAVEADTDFARPQAVTHDHETASLHDFKKPDVVVRDVIMKAEETAPDKG